MKAILVKDLNIGPEYLEVPKPETMMKSEVYIKNLAMSLSLEDVAMIKGQGKRLYGEFTASNPIPGFCAIGEIKKVGSEVKGFEEKDKVIYMLGTKGSLCERRTIHNSFCFKAPRSFSISMLGAITRAGVTAHMLLFQTVNLRKGNYILIHDISAPLNQILCRWANISDIKTIVSITQDSHKEHALKCGANMVISSTDDKFTEKVLSFTEGNGVNVVYDSIGTPVQNASLECLRIAGVYIYLFGSRYPITSFPASIISEKSLFISSPVIEHYKSNRGEVMRALNAFFKFFLSNQDVIKLIEYPMHNVAKAYKDIEEGKTTHCPVIIP